MTANKVTLQDIEDEIISEEYHMLPGTTTTLCVLTGKTGWTTVGFNACVDPANFDEELGKKYAREEAFEQWWPMLGFRMKDKMAAQPTTFVGRMVQELVELEGNIVKLETFTGTAPFKNIPEIEQDDLTVQLTIMKSYARVLRRRYERNSQ